MRRGAVFERQVRQPWEYKAGFPPILRRFIHRCSTLQEPHGGVLCHAGLEIAAVLIIIKGQARVTTEANSLRDGPKARGAELGLLGEGDWLWPLLALQERRRSNFTFKVSSLDGLQAKVVPLEVFRSKVAGLMGETFWLKQEALDALWTTAAARFTARSEGPARLEARLEPRAEYIIPPLLQNQCCPDMSALPAARLRRDPPVQKEPSIAEVLLAQRVKAIERAEHTDFSQKHTTTRGRGRDLVASPQLLCMSEKDQMRNFQRKMQASKLRQKPQNKVQPTNSNNNNNRNPQRKKSVNIDPVGDIPNLLGSGVWLPEPMTSVNVWTSSEVYHKMKEVGVLFPMTSREQEAKTREEDISEGLLHAKTNNNSNESKTAGDSESEAPKMEDDSSPLRRAVSFLSDGSADKEGDSSRPRRAVSFLSDGSADSSRPNNNDNNKNHKKAAEAAGTSSSFHSDPPDSAGDAAESARWSPLERALSSVQEGKKLQQQQKQQQQQQQQHQQQQQQQQLQQQQQQQQPEDNDQGIRPPACGMSAYDLAMSVIATSESRICSRNLISPGTTLGRGISQVMECYLPEDDAKSADEVFEEVAELTGLLPRSPGLRSPRPLARRPLSARPLATAARPRPQSAGGIFHAAGRPRAAEELLQADFTAPAALWQQNLVASKGPARRPSSSRRSRGIAMHAHLSASLAAFRDRNLDPLLREIKHAINQ
ncbi:unnamed protein product [Polarella glacialis]|uniref:Cyclic nucleotide-binding domain-containing protein n=1 Tax=Polarella glacialis TaxID=89957 RepID=A0A813J357_POLGL|nr:unnamed protein product [Polarella glacialis]